jgi:flagellar export protein FliJ
VLWHRRILEEQAEQALAATLLQERELARQLRQTRRQAEEEAALLLERLGHPTAGNELWLHVCFAAALAARQSMLQARSEEATRRVGERRLALRERRRAREVLSRLRQRAVQRYLRTVEQEAQRLLDEAAAVRWSRPEGD